MQIKNYSQIANEIIAQIENELDITTPPGGVVRTLANILGGEISKLYVFLNQLSNNLYIGEAGGELLDAFGAIFGLTRKPARYFDRITGVRFYVNSGTLGDVIASDFFISNDVKVTDGTNEFSVIPTALTSSDLAGQYVEVVCEPSNVSKTLAERNTLTSFTPNTEGLYVTNPANIKLYSPTETDEQFRYRVSRHLAINRMANGRQYRLSNRASLRIAALNVTGVADVYIKEFTSGGGSFTIYVVGEDLNNDSLLPGQVANAISPIVPYGTQFTATLPTKTKVYVELVGNYSSTDELINELDSVLREYVDDVRIGGELNLKDFERLITQTSASYGTTSDIKIYIAQDDSLGVEHSRLLTDSYQCLDNEKLMLAPSDAVVV
jgi:uncharacterized phage protein gp47/JayE